MNRDSDPSPPHLTHHINQLSIFKCSVCSFPNACINISPTLKNAEKTNRWKLSKKCRFMINERDKCKEYKYSRHNNDDQGWHVHLSQVSLSWFTACYHESSFEHRRPLKVYSNKDVAMKGDRGRGEDGRGVVLLPFLLQTAPLSEQRCEGNRR